MIKKNKQLLSWVVCLLTALYLSASVLIAYAEENEILNEQLLTIDSEWKIKEDDKGLLSGTNSVVFLDDYFFSASYSGDFSCFFANGSNLNIYLENNDAARKIYIRILKDDKEIINTPILSGKTYTYTRALDVYGDYEVIVGSTSGFRIDGYVRARQYK